MRVKTAGKEDAICQNHESDKSEKHDLMYYVVGVDLSCYHGCRIDYCSVEDREISQLRASRRDGGGRGRGSDNGADLSELRRPYIYNSVADEDLEGEEQAAQSVYSGASFDFSLVCFFIGRQECAVVR